MFESVRRWAHVEFGRTPLGDVRRTKRLVQMAVNAAQCPSGKVSAVFERIADREGAYDFLENPHVKAEALAESMFAATAERARGEAYAFVSIDGSSLSLTDAKGSKGFGSVGSANRAVQGVMVVNALAVSSMGVPLGLIDQLFWNRAKSPETGLESWQRAKRNQARPFEEKEPSKLIDAVRNARRRLGVAGVKAWVVIDAESDNRDILTRLVEEDCFFTVRAHVNRVISGVKLNEALDVAPRLGTHEIHIARSGARAARTALMEVHATQLTLQFTGHIMLPNESASLYAVRVRELGAKSDPLEWVLYTNVPVLTASDARTIVESYRTRWRVEEFHRTWKQGQCNVEDAQLRSLDAMLKWATILAAVATRIERLKYLSRQMPEAPATLEFSLEEIEALKLNHDNKSSKRTPVPAMPTILEATHWAARLGGWIGPQNGPPGSTVIARGLQRLTFLVEGIALARQLNAEIPKRKRRT